MIDLDDPRYAAFAAARDDYWNALGDVDADVIAYMISPEFQGAPPWPTTRQAFRTVRLPGSVIIASDGLSDPFVDTDLPDAGFGCEVYIETDALVGADFAAIRDSWAFALIEQWARNVANWGGINGTLDRLDIVSTELATPDALPPDWRTSDGTAGLLVNLPAPGRATHLALDADHVIRMVPITLLTPAETAMAASGGADGRAELAARLNRAGTGVLSSTKRAGVVEP